MKDTFSTREPEESSKLASWDDKGTWGTYKARDTAFRRTHKDSPRSLLVGKKHLAVDVHSLRHRLQGKED